MADLGIRGKKPLAGIFRCLALGAKAFRPVGVWSGLARHVPSRNYLRRQNSERRQAGRPSRAAANKIQIVRQPQDGQGAGSHDSHINPAPRNRCGRMTNLQISNVLCGH